MENTLLVRPGGRETLAGRAQLLVSTLTAAATDYCPATFSSSLSAEDMVITDVILALRLDIEIFMIDTGRMHADTLAMLDLIRSRYGYEVRVYAPEAAAVTRYVSQHGRDAFYDSTELRRECCNIRKVEPLKRALHGKALWVTGLRRVAAARDAVPLQQFDAEYGLVKLNPLAEWSEEDVWEYVHANEVPYNRLYEQGYRSIGCAPCTRPTTAGEDVRAGRWWWEQGEVKECGLHMNKDGRLVRGKEAA